jgi:peptidoglycan/xylan/chitin deacetylase (PgdA/CDA1 family)
MARRLILASLILTTGQIACAEIPGVMTRMPTHERVIALTFDACQAEKVMHLDQAILDVLERHPVPFTVFASGRFVQSNRPAVAELAHRPGVRVENHSWSHARDMRVMSDGEVESEIGRTDEAIENVTGRRPELVRFPGGNVDERLVRIAQSTGHRVVHWRWAEGDPARAIDASMLISQTLERVRPGDILIFHINGRGWHTAEALPDILNELETRGYRFVDLVGLLGSVAPSESSDEIKHL